MVKDESAKDRVIRLLKENCGGEDQVQAGPTFHGDRNVNISGNTVLIIRCPVADNGCSYRQLARAVQHLTTMLQLKSEASNDD